MFAATILLCLLSFGSAFAGNSSPRINELFNFDWKFSMGNPPGADKRDFDDSSWRKLDLPHDFQFEMPWDSTASRGRGFKPMGTAWYRKTFTADPAWKGRRVLIDFGGIMLHGDVYLNGKHIGGTDYGYLGFESDMSQLLDYERPNVIAVHADTGKEGGSRWYTGGGIFRDVRLIVKDHISVSRHGVFITTPEISEKQASVDVQVQVEGIKMSERSLSLKVAVLDPAGNIVGETSVSVPKRSRRDSEEVRLPSLKVVEPKLWSNETPWLYTAKVDLLDGDKVIDQVSERFGIRTIEFSKEEGFKLNGKKVFLKGIAIHHDLGALGGAAFETAISRMMDRIKEFGFNHIRTSHNPYSEAFLRIADEKGILVVDELYDKWSNTVAWAGRRPWTDCWHENLTEWVKRDRNHPSVILWSLGNELQFQEVRCGIPGTNDWGVTTYRIMSMLLKRHDPTRLTTVAMYPARAGGIVKHDPDFRKEENRIAPELATVTDVASFNYCWDDYEAYLKHNPDMIVYQSEAVTNELTAPFFGMDRDKMVGLAYWGAIEYWGESNAWPKKGWMYSFFNHSLEPFPQAYLMKATFTDVPDVHIGVVDSEGEAELWNDIVVGQKVISSHWNRKPGSVNTVYTYTNADEVELFLNGKSLGVKKNLEQRTRRNVIKWDNVAYKPGNLTAVARNNGKVVATHKIETTGKPVKLVAETENPGWKADGMDLQYVRVYAVDGKGRKVPTAAGEIKFDVVGEASLLAVDNGCHTSEHLFRGDSIGLHRGFAMAILRSSRIPGTVTLKASCSGLKPVIVKFDTK
ncbi:MAG: DUF4982 domain-containing protein [Muribaculaceae bacterium]|nr:DUF4982 domain-containing protein [Muribaculaceae bacterium]